jgi:hypothetical protein
MVGVRRPLRVEWLADGETVAVETLRPWTGWAIHRADTVVESRPPPGGTTEADESC